ncbi:MAG: ATP-binding cassette domain-containing protein [Bifidobacteriaceae bacterium]|jgi:ABC-type oligopeptide transport system ATPase subunit|nr:ATP-binding cassette domain-containing protein [Bifidobacteriaceae bacterium]
MTDQASLILEVHGLTKTFPGRAKPAIADVAFNVRRGSSLGIVGESGSGKSTTARCIAGLIPADKGEVVLDGRQIDGLDRGLMRQVRRHLQMVFQDPFSSLDPRMTAEELVGEGLLVHGLAKDKRARREAVVRNLELVGLSAADLERYPRAFSGGQRQRIAIARAIAVRPKLLICDEPVSSLDVSVQAQVLNLLLDLKAQLGLSILFIAHDLAVVRYLCEDVVVMNEGRVVEAGSRDDIFDSPRHPYTKSLLAAVPVPDPRMSRRRAPLKEEP